MLCDSPARCPRAHRDEFPGWDRCCGTEDFLLDDYRHSITELADLGVHMTYEEGPGTHEWGFWDQWIRRVLEWMLN